MFWQRSRIQASGLGGVHLSSDTSQLRDADRFDFLFIIFTMHCSKSYKPKKNQIIYISECQEAVTYVICTSSISICLPGEADDKLDSQTTWELDPALRRRRGRFTFTGYKSFLHLPFR